MYFAPQNLAMGLNNHRTNLDTEILRLGGTDKF